MRPIAAVRRVFGAAGRSLAVLGRAVVAGLGALGVAGVMGPLGRVRRGFRGANTARKGFREGVKQGTGRLNVGGADGPLRGIGRVMGTMTRLVGRLALGFLGGPIGWIITGAWLLWEFWDPISDWWDGVWKGLKDTWEKTEWLKDIGAAFKREADAARRVWNGMTGWWDRLWTGLKEATNTDWLADIGKAFKDELQYIQDIWEPIVAFFEDTWARIQTAVGGSENPVARLSGPAAIASRNAAQGGQAGAAPSIFAPSAGESRRPSAGAPGAARSHARVTVDFINLPRGTRTETRADSDTDLEVNTGFALQSAF